MSNTSYPAQYAVQPLDGPVHASVRVPGSKSITNRALVLAALCGGSKRSCELVGTLDSEDTRVMADSLARLGYTVDANWQADTIRVQANSERIIPADHADLFVANSGTTMRFLTAMVALGQGRYRLDGVARMRERPIRDLLDALTQLGVHATSESSNGCPPVVIAADGLQGGTVRIKGDVSSQFLSGLLMAAPFCRANLVIEVDGPLVSVPYVEMTLAIMRQFGLHAETDAFRRFRIPGRQVGGVASYRVEPDASAASYFFALPAIVGGSVTVTGLSKQSLQGDVAFVDKLAQMGCTVQTSGDLITVTGGALRGIDVDMNAISDTVMTLGVVACFATGPTNIRNVAHIRHKETDRVAALATELRRIGATVNEREDGLTITPGPLHGAIVQTYNDHRMAMALALAGLKVPCLIIDNPACVAKTYPRFFEDLEKVGAANDKNPAS